MFLTEYLLFIVFMSVFVSSKMFVSLEKNIKSYPSAYQYCIVTIIYTRYTTTTSKWLLLITHIVGSKKIPPHEIL